MNNKILMVAASFNRQSILRPRGIIFVPPMLNADRAAISDFLRARVDRGDVPAVVAALSNRDALLYVDAFGIALDGPVTTYLPDYRQPPVLTTFNGADLTYDSRPATTYLPMSVIESSRSTAGTRAGSSLNSPIPPRLSLRGLERLVYLQSQ